MAIPSKQIGWSKMSSLLYDIIKQLEKLIKVAGSSSGGGTVTNVTASSPLSSSGGATPNITLSSPLPIANGGTGSVTQNFVDLTTSQLIAGDKTFSSNNFFISNPAGTFKYGIIGSAIAADRTITIPAVSTNTFMMLMTAFGSNGGIPLQAGGNRYTQDSTFNYSSGVLTLTNIQISDDIRITEGSNKSVGVATLVGGTILVSTTAVNANSRIFLTHQNTSGTIGVPHVSARVAGTSFTITSTSGTDTSSIAWLIIN